jgi:hypothetical protein
LWAINRQVITMHYDIYPVEWSAELRMQEARRRAEQRRLVRLIAEQQRRQRVLWLAARLQRLAEWLHTLVEEPDLAHPRAAVR